MPWLLPACCPTRSGTTGCTSTSKSGLQRGEGGGRGCGRAGRSSPTARCCGSGRTTSGRATSSPPPGPGSGAVEGRGRADAGTRSTAMRSSRTARWTEGAVEEGRPDGVAGHMRFRASGWFLVRAIVDNPKTFRFASTAPCHVEVGGAKRRVSKSSARFFLEWAKERAGRVQVDDAAQEKSVCVSHRRGDVLAGRAGEGERGVGATK